MHTTTAGGVMLWCDERVVLEWPDFATAFAERYDIARLRLRFEELLAALPSEDQLTETVTAAFDAQLWELHVQRHVASITPGELQPVTGCANMGCACREQALHTAGPKVNELSIYVPDLQCGHPLVDMGYGIVDLAAEVILRRIEADRIRAFANNLRADSDTVLASLLPTE